MKFPLFFVFLLSILPSCDDNDIRITAGLTGQWKWKFSCGGFVGCVYAEPERNRILNITNSTIKITDDEKVTFVSNYAIRDFTYRKGSRIFQIMLIDGPTWTITVSEDDLTTEYSVLSSAYERIK